MKKELLGTRIMVLDSIMGSGKTTQIFHHINKNPKRKYVCAVRYLDEISRYIKECPNANFITPSDELFGSKQAHFHVLLNDCQNIIVTHELFRRIFIMQHELELLHTYNYELIMDETAEVIEILNISPHDKEEILLRYVEVGEDYLVRWTCRDYSGNHEEIKRRIESQAIRYYKGSFLWLLPINLIKAFSSVFIVTFLFEGSHMSAYLRIHGLSYDYFHVRNHKLVPGKQNVSEILPEIREKLDIYDGKFNDIGDPKTALSVSWYENKQNKELVKKLERNARNYLEKECKACVSQAQWTVFKDKSKKGSKKKQSLCGKYYVSSFVACNAVATNEHKDRKHLAYLVNVFDNPMIRQWFIEQGSVPDEEKYALSQMMQWIWRSAIREGNPITVYIPSKRMRNILKKFLSTDEEKNPSTTPYKAA
ncbi:MAG: DEAD/DEAH box helicase family protein [Christensenellales bacterium]